MNNVCGNCIHWGNEKDINERFRVCHGIIHDEYYRVENDNNRPEDIEPEEIEENKLFMDQNLAVTVDGSGYIAQLKCREDFSCKLFKEKDI